MPNGFLTSLELTYIPFACGNYRLSQQNVRIDGGRVKGPMKLDHELQAIQIPPVA